MPQTEAHPDSSTQLTRYVEHPGRRRAIRAGRRNLAWGVAFLFAALCICGIALFVGGPRAVLPPMLFLACFTVLWVLARMKVFSQRNGVFFGLAVTALLGASAALLEQAWFYLAKRTANGEGVLPTVTLNSAVSSAPAAPEFPLLTQSLKYEEPEPTLPRVRASRNFNISIGGRTYSIRKGDTFQFRDEKNNEFIIVAGEFLARVPLDSMDQLTPEPARAADAKGTADDGKGAIEKAAIAKITKKAQEEAARRFPALRQQGSAENKLYLEAYNDLKKRNSEFLEDPEWPMRLAEILAQRNQWQESGVVDFDAPPVTEPSIAPGTKMLSEPHEIANPHPSTPPAPAAAPASRPPADDGLPKRDSDIPPPPRGPQ
jgi:hypothetical protein